MTGPIRWADQYFRKTGRWPNGNSGPIVNAPGETWSAVDAALVAGIRGLPAGGSLAKLLVERRGIRSPGHLPPLKISQILKWADDFRQRHGSWPTHQSGSIAERDGETWLAVDSALRSGSRSLPGDSSLSQLLAKRRGHRNRRALPPFRIEEILTWSDRHYRETGKWPNEYSGPVALAPGETWAAVNTALFQGIRGLPGGTSIVRLLIERRGIRSRGYRPPLTNSKVLAWADAHFHHHGSWPSLKSGVIAETDGETWMAVEMALGKGRRGLPGGTTLARFLAKHRGVKRWTNKCRGSPRHSPSLSR